MMTTHPSLHALLFGSHEALLRRAANVLQRLYPESRLVERSDSDLAAQDLKRSIYDVVILAIDSNPADLLPLIQCLEDHETPMPVFLLLHSDLQQELFETFPDLPADWEVALSDRASDAFIARSLRSAISRYEVKWERDHLQRAFQSSLLQYRSLFDEVPDLIFLCDRAGCLLDVNATVSRVFGIDREAVLRKPIFEAFGLEESVFQDLGCSRHPAVRDRSRTLKLNFVPPTGESIFGLTHMIARRDNPGHPIQFQGVIKDISRRRDLEAQLRDHSKHLELMVTERTGELTNTMNFLHGILEGATEYAIFGLDEAGTFVHFNRGAQLILNFDPEEMVGRRKLDSLLDFNEGEFDSLESLLREVDLNGVLVREWVVRAGDDRNVVMHMTVNRLREVDSANLVYVGIARDVTEQKELEGLLKVYTENLEIVLEEKSPGTRAETYRTHPIEQAGDPG